MNDVPTFSPSFKTKAIKSSLTSSKNHKGGQTKLEALYVVPSDFDVGIFGDINFKSKI